MDTFGCVPFFPPLFFLRWGPHFHPPTYFFHLDSRNEWFLDWTYYCLVCLLWWTDDDDVDGFSYCIMALHGYENFNLHPLLAHVKNIYVYIWSTTTYKVLDCQKVACKYINNASIYSSPIYIYIYSNNNSFGRVIDFTWMNFFFHPREWKFGKCSSSIHVVEAFIILLQWVFKSKFGNFSLSEEWNVEKWSSKKAIFNWKPWMTTWGGRMNFLWNRRLFGDRRPLYKSMIVTSDFLLRQARKAWRALGRIFILFYWILFYFIEELWMRQTMVCE